MFPGPLINAPANDNIHVNVFNDMAESLLKTWYRALSLSGLLHNRFSLNSGKKKKKKNSLLAKQTFKMKFQKNNNTFQLLFIQYETSNFRITNYFIITFFLQF